MNLQVEVKQAVYQETEFLSGLEKPDVTRLLEQAQSDRRVRNVTPFYALLYQPEKFLTLVQEDRFAASLNLQVKKALYRLEHSTSEASELAKEYRQLFFPKGKMVVLKRENDVSEEMAKMLQSLVRAVKLRNEVTEEEETFVKNKLLTVDFNNLV